MLLSSRQGELAIEAERVVLHLECIEGRACVVETWLHHTRGTGIAILSRLPFPFKRTTALRASRMKCPHRR